MMTRRCVGVAACARADILEVSDLVVDRILAVVSVHIHVIAAPMIAVVHRGVITSKPPRPVPDARQIRTCIVNVIRVLSCKV